MTADEFDEHLRLIRAEYEERARQQEKFWQRQMSNWESQEKYWRWQQWILLGTFVLGVLGIVSRVFWP
jgi:hypothetical protein